MKRRYKKGDWFAVPLGSGREAAGVIAAQDRSRLFGYFFMLPRGDREAAGLETLQPSDAIWRGCFLGDGLEDRRWILMTSAVRAASREWELPPTVAEGIENVPEARFERAALVEARLRGVTDALAVRELRSPLDLAGLSERLASTGRVQFGAPLDALEIHEVAAFLRAHPQIELRIHGHYREAFDASALAAFTGVERLILDVALPSLDALAPLAPHLESLTLGRHVRAPFAALALPRVRRLKLHGTALSANARASLPALRDLVLVDAPMHDLWALAPFAELESLAVRFGAPAGVDAIARLECLRNLELRGLRDLRALPHMEALRDLRTLVLAALPRIAHLQPLTQARALERVEILAMEHLRVEDLDVLRTLAPHASFAIDIGGRRKNREVYRRLQVRTDVT